MGKSELFFFQIKKSRKENNKLMKTKLEEYIYATKALMVE